MPLRVVEFVLGEDIVLAGLLDGLSTGAETTEERVFVDTFDGRLHAAGVVGVAGEPVDPAVVGNRALLPVARVRSTLRERAVRNRDDKIVVRLREEHPRVVGGGPLDARLTVREVLGYGKAFDATVATLVAAGLREPTEPLPAAAVRAAGRDPAGVSSKPDVALAPATPSGAAAAVLLARLADIAEANVPGTLEDLDVEFLHDLRVAVRRARSVLRELKAVFPREDLAHVRAELKWVQAVTGPVRDLDVQLEDLDALAAGLDPQRRTDLEPLRALLRRRRATALRDLRRTLRGKRFRAAMVAWRALEPSDGAAALLPIDVLAAERIRSVYRHMVRDGRAIDDASPDEALHDLRKRGKELRYLAELFGQLFPKDVVKPMVRTLKDLQDVLGRFQDRAVQVELLGAAGADLARLPEGPAALMALGLVVDELRRDQVRARGEFYDRFAPFADKAQRATVKATFRA